MDTIRSGEKAEVAVLSALVQIGKEVLLPFGTRRYDMAFLEKGKLHRVQCKSGWLSKGGIHFHTRQTRDNRGYSKDAEFFGIAVSVLGTVYLVPIAVTGGILRLEPTKNNQQKRIVKASDYQIFPQ